MVNGKKKLAGLSVLVFGAGWLFPFWQALVRRR